MFLTRCGEQGWISLTRSHEDFQPFDKSGQFPAMFVATSTDIFNDMSGRYPAVLHETKPDVLNELYE